MGKRTVLPWNGEGHRTAFLSRKAFNIVGSNMPRTSVRSLGLTGLVMSYTADFYKSTAAAVTGCTPPAGDRSVGARIPWQPGHSVRKCPAQAALSGPRRPRAAPQSLPVNTCAKPSQPSAAVRHAYRLGYDVSNQRTPSAVLTQPAVSSREDSTAKI